MGVDVSFTNSALYMVLAALIPLVFLYVVTKSPQIIPGFVQSIAEIIYTYVSRMIDETNGEKGRPYFLFVFAVFVFVATSNLLGMLPFSFTFTSQLVVTTCLAVGVFGVVTLVGLLKHKGKFFSLFFPSGAAWVMAPLLIPVEILSYLSRPFSLSIRLFANMMAGHTMLKVFAGFTFF